MTEQKDYREVLRGRIAELEHEVERLKAAPAAPVAVVEPRRELSVMQIREHICDAITGLSFIQDAIFQKNYGNAKEYAEMHEKNLQKIADEILTEAQRTEGAQEAAWREIVEKLSSPTSWWDYDNKTCRFCSSREFDDEGKLLIHKPSCEITEARAALAGTQRATPKEKENV